MSSYLSRPINHPTCVSHNHFTFPITFITSWYLNEQNNCISMPNSNSGCLLQCVFPACEQLKDRASIRGTSTKANVNRTWWTWCVSRKCYAKPETEWKDQELNVLGLSAKRKKKKAFTILGRTTAFASICRVMKFKLALVWSLFPFAYDNIFWPVQKYKGAQKLFFPHLF